MRAVVLPRCCPRGPAVRSAWRLNFSRVSTSAELESTTIAVAPGGEATAVLAVRNDTDIVEAYEFEVVGECASWTVVEPARLSLYPGTRGTVTLRLRPPRSPEVPAGEVPLAVRVLPVERPELVTVPEGTVYIGPFQMLRGWLAPQRRRGWRSGRFWVVLHNQGNTPFAVGLEPADPAEELKFRLDEQQPALEPGEQREVRLRARARKLHWFGKPPSKPFTVTAAPDAGEVSEHELAPPEQFDGELHQIPIFPKWLLALLALLLALLLLWFTLVRPQVQRSAKEAAEEQAREMAAAGELVPPGGQPEEPQPEPPKPQPETPPKQPGEGDALNTTPGGGQESVTLPVVTDGADNAAGTWTVPEGKVFFATDLVVANNQGDEGVLTISFGDRLITRIALETFRNQDYHWVTPIQVPAGERITAAVTCARPGTPATGQQATQCSELLNVAGVLRNAQP